MLKHLFIFSIMLALTACQTAQNIPTPEDATEAGIGHFAIKVGFETNEKGATSDYYHVFKILSLEDDSEYDLTVKASANKGFALLENLNDGNYILKGYQTAVAKKRARYKGELKFQEFNAPFSVKAGTATIWEYEFIVEHTVKSKSSSTGWKFEEIPTADHDEITNALYKKFDLLSNYSVQFD